MTDRELMQQAIDALESRCGTNAEERKELIPAIRARLAQPERPAVQPVQPIPDSVEWYGGAKTDEEIFVTERPAVQGEPDKEVLRFLSDVVTAAGLLEHGRQSKALAERISSSAYSLLHQLYTVPPAPTASKGE